MKKLFVSFSSLLRLVGESKVTADDLAQGLYFFGCRREHALNPGAAGEADERTWHKSQFAHAHPGIVEALLQAEQDGRAAWHNCPNRQESPWNELNELLASNGLASLGDTHTAHFNYSYPAVTDAAAAARLPVEVVY